jgi:IclR family acetate operon transcriptional repressor
VPYVFDAFIAESIEGSYGVRATSYVGTRSAYHSTACGKAMLAYFDDAARRALYAARPLVPATPNTITDPAILERQLAQVRRAGYALDLEENEPSASCVAAPIFDGFGQVAGAISVSGISSRMTQPVMLDLARQIIAETKAIGEALCAAPAPSSL